MALAVEDQIALNGSHPSLAHVQAAIGAAHRILAARQAASEQPAPPNNWQPSNPLLPGPRLDFPPGTRLDPDGVPYGASPNPATVGPYTGALVPYIRPQGTGIGGNTINRDYYGPGGSFPFPPAGPDQGYTTNPAILAARRLLLAHRESPVVRT